LGARRYRRQGEKYAALQRLIADERFAGANDGELIEALKALRGQPGVDAALIESVLSSELGWHTPDRFVR